MKIEFKLNGQTATFEAGANDTLYGMLRALGISSVKCGCETTNCGLCTVHMDGKAVLSCSVPAMRCNGRDIRTLEGMGDAAKALADCLADEGADQCGFCAPGMMMNVLMLAKGNPNATDEEADVYLAGNLCRCTGYMSQKRAIRRFLNRVVSGEVRV